MKAATLRTMAQDPKLTVLRFNECINHRDLEGLVSLMTSDHRFVDAAGRQVRGREAVRDAWRGFFSKFPDYQNVFAQLTSHGQEVVIVGNSTCTESTLNGAALWKVRVDAGLIVEWCVFDDNAETRRALGLGRKS